MPLLDRLTMNPQVMHGRPTVRGMRIRVADVLSMLASGATESEILSDHPYLESDDIKSRLEYAAAQAGHAVLTTQ